MNRKNTSLNFPSSWERSQNAVNSVSTPSKQSSILQHVGNEEDCALRSSEAGHAIQNCTHTSSPPTVGLVEIARNTSAGDTERAGRRPDAPPSPGYVSIAGVTEDDSDVVSRGQGGGDADGQGQSKNPGREEGIAHPVASISRSKGSSAGDARATEFSPVLGPRENGCAAAGPATVPPAVANQDGVSGQKKTQRGQIKTKNFKHLSIQIPEPTKLREKRASQPDKALPPQPSCGQRGGKSPRRLASTEGDAAGDVTGSPRNLTERTTGGKGREKEVRSEEGRLCDQCSTSCCGRKLRDLPLVRKVRQWMDRNVLEGNEVRNTVVVGIAFQLVFTAHFAIQNLQSSLHEEHYLGVSALGCLYATSIFSSIFSPTILGLLGTKGSLVTAWVCQIVYTVAQFYPSWATLVPASIIWGFMVGPTWTAQGIYVTACAYSFSKRSNDSPYAIVSRFQGLFFTLFETRQVLGNILSSAFLMDGISNATDAEIVFRFCGPHDCPYYENVTDIEEPHQRVMSGLLGFYLALQVVALGLTIFLVAPLPRNEWSAQAPLRETATSWIRTLVGTKMIFLVPFMIFQAMEEGILLSEYTKSYVSCPIGIHMVGFVMATHGATSAAFVFLFSRLAHFTGRFPLFALAAVISLIFLVVLYDWTPSANEEGLIFFFPVLWGVGEGIWQTQTNAMIAVTFWDQKEPAFANYQTWRAVGFTIVFGFHSLLCVSTKIAICLAFLFVGMALYTGVEIFTRWQERVRVPHNQEPGGVTSPDQAMVIRVPAPDPADAASQAERGISSSSSSPVTSYSTTTFQATSGPAQGVKRGSQLRRDDDAEAAFGSCSAAGDVSVPSPPPSATCSSDGAVVGCHSDGETKKRRLRIRWKQTAKRAKSSKAQALRSKTAVSDVMSADPGDDTRCALCGSSAPSSPRTVSAVLPMTDGDGRVRPAVRRPASLDLAMLDRGETSHLDYDPRRCSKASTAGKRHASSITSPTPSVSSSRPLLPSDRPYSRWNSRETTDADSVWLEDDKDGELISPRVSSRPDSWYQDGFRDEGELRVVWTKDDVFVY